MRKLICLPMLALLPMIALAAENPDWAYPGNLPPPQPDNVTLKTVPGSTKQYTQAQIDDPFNPPDWFPDEHPPMPQIVAHGGQRPAGRACAQCHQPSGDGHPEAAVLAGLPADYFVRQMAAFKNAERKGIRANFHVAMAKVLSDAEVKAAAEYFATLKPTIFYKVVETETVAKSYVSPSGMRLAAPDGGTESIGNRIIVLPQDPARAVSRDPKSGFIDYVPVGSIAKGEALVMTGGADKTIPCATCHGPTLKNFDEIPSIVGRPAIYTFRQLNDMQNGNRAGAGVELMKAVVANLTQDDMVAISAYLASRDP